MAVVAVNLREINLRREDIDAEVKIKNVTNNINLTNLKQVDFPLSDTGKALVFSFEYKSDYEMSEPKEGVLGTIYMSGDVLFTEKKKVLDSALKSWKDKQKVDDEVLLPVLQAAFNTVNIEAIYLSRKVLLPSPIQLPQIAPQKK